MKVTVTIIKESMCQWNVLLVLISCLLLISIEGQAQSKRMEWVEIYVDYWTKPSSEFKGAKGLIENSRMLEVSKFGPSRPNTLKKIQYQIANLTAHPTLDNINTRVVAVFNYFDNSADTLEIDNTGASKWHGKIYETDTLLMHYLQVRFDFSMSWPEIKKREKQIKAAQQK